MKVSVEITKIEGRQPATQGNTFGLTTNIEIDGRPGWCHGQQHPFGVLSQALEIEAEWRAERQVNVAAFLADFFRLAGVYVAQSAHQDTEKCPGCGYSYDTCECPYPDQVDAAFASTSQSPRTGKAT